MGGLVRWLVAVRLSVQVTRNRFPLDSFSTWIRVDRELQGVETIEFNGFRWVLRYCSCLFSGTDS